MHPVTTRVGTLDGDTRIMTLSGERRIADLAIDDIIFTPDGRPTVVRNVTSHGTARAFRLTLKDGRELIAGQDQVIPHTTYAKAKFLRTAPVRILATDFVYATKANQPGYRYYVPMHGAISYPEVEHTIDPYALGLLIGNGALTQKTLTILTPDDVLMYELLNALKLPEHVARRLPDSSRWHLASHVRVDNVRKELRRLDLMGKSAREKFIPSAYLYDSVEHRRALLDGLLDASGHINIRPKTNAVSYAFTTQSLTLASDVERLAWSLGYGVRKTGNDKRRAGAKLTIYTPDTLGRSRQMLLARQQGAYTSKHDSVTNVIHIEEIAPREMWSLIVEAKWFIAGDFITLCDSRGLLPEARHPFLRI